MEPFRGSNIRYIQIYHVSTSKYRNQRLKLKHGETDERVEHASLKKNPLEYSTPLSFWEAKLQCYKWRSPLPQNVMGWDVRGCSVALGTLVNVPNIFSKRKPHKEESGSCHNTHTMGRKNSGNPTGHNSNKPKRKARLVHTTAPVVSTHPATSNYVPLQFQTNEQKTNDLKKILKIV